MVDWMIEVTDNFCSCHQTFFYSVSIMDRYFKACPNVLEFSQLHLIGAASMFIASKFEDSKPLTMKEVLERICHHEFQLEEVK